MRPVCQRHGEPATWSSEQTSRCTCPRGATRITFGNLFLDACARQSAIFKEMAPLANAINAASVTSIAGFRAKALVAFWEIAPLSASDSDFSFDDAWPFQQLFTAVAELCGLKDKMAATGYEFPDIGMVEAAPDDDDADDEGEEA